MKFIRLTLSLLAATVLCQCAGMPSVSGLGAGSDAAYLNANRGRADAQISRAQAEQYSRQRQQVSEEMQLEQQKKNNFYQNAGGILGIANGISNLAR